jgi:hypothetical protein
LCWLREPKGREKVIRRSSTQRGGKRIVKRRTEGKSGERGRKGKFHPAHGKSEIFYKFLSSRA